MTDEEFILWYMKELDKSSVKGLKAIIKVFNEMKEEGI